MHALLGGEVERNVSGVGSPPFAPSQSQLRFGRDGSVMVEIAERGAASGS